VLTRLLQGEQHGEKLSELELLHNIIFILNAGHETTTNLIGNGLYALLQWPRESSAYQRSGADPIRGRRGAAVRKLQPARQSRDHGARRDRRCADGGRNLHHHRHWRGQPRPGRVRGPGSFEIAREPNRHLAFGSGAHVCAGLNIARLEGRIAIGHLLARFPRYRLAGKPIRGGRAPFSRLSGATCADGLTLDGLIRRAASRPQRCAQTRASAWPLALTETGDKGIAHKPTGIGVVPAHKGVANQAVTPKRKDAMQDYDYIVVGAGSSGAVLAAR
jgi:hypothetical protein